jgi:hypothetical protein
MVLDKRIYDLAGFGGRLIEAMDRKSRYRNRKCPSETTRISLERILLPQQLICYDVSHHGISRPVFHIKISTNMLLEKENFIYNIR